MFDTNVLISALLIPASKPREALDVALRTGTVLASVPLISELHDVLTRKDFSRYIEEQDILTFMAALSQETEFIEVRTTLNACRDRKDNMLLELAVGGQATHLITGDADLLTMNPFRGIQIVTPGAFLELARD